MKCAHSSIVCLYWLLPVWAKGVARWSYVILCLFPSVSKWFGQTTVKVTILCLCAQFTHLSFWKSLFE